MAMQDRNAALVRSAVVAAGLLLPTLTLVPLGSLWLWEHGYILHWALAVALLVTLAYLWQRWLFRRPFDPPPREAVKPTSEPSVDADAPDPAWTALERQAWQDVLKIARAVDPDRLASREALLAVATETIQRVAMRIHPEVTEPIWQFTVPEALAIVERVSRRLGRFFAANIPLSDRLTVARVLAFYRWRGALDVAERAYDVWRVIRLANPLAAATNEMRERLSRQMLQWGKDHLARQLTEAYIREVGRAAIDLYGGRLRVAGEAAPADRAVASAGEAQGSSSEPLRLLVGGQKGVGKTALVQALFAEMQADIGAVLTGDRATSRYEIRKAPHQPALIVESPAIGQVTSDERSMVIRAIASDLVVWVVAPDRSVGPDRIALDALRADARARPPGAAPPVLVVLAGIDRLPPEREWKPPYDLASPDRPKSAAIRITVERAASALGIAASAITPVALRPDGSYNVDALWARMLGALPDARRVQLMRRLDVAPWYDRWKRVGEQAIGVGRILAGTLRRR